VLLDSHTVQKFSSEGRLPFDPGGGVSGMGLPPGSRSPKRKSDTEHLRMMSRPE
jgi:hypothetical protein